MHLHLSFRRKQEDLESLIKIEMGWKRGLILPASLVAGDKMMFYLRNLVKVEELRRRLDRVYDIGAFDLVDFELVDEDGHSDLVIEPRERAKIPIPI